MRPRAKILLFVRRFLIGRSGIAAVEFALIAPLLLTIWLGMAELSQIMTASAKTNLAAQSVADLVSRYTSKGYTDPKGFSDLEAAAATILAPMPTASGNPLVSVVSANLSSSGAPTQSWQCTTGTMPPTYSVATLLAAAPALTTQNSNLTSVIMVTVSFSYSPTISGGITGPQTFTSTAYSTPRTVSAIPKPC
jgi:Flp pilus assembly protein TadG